MATTCLMLLLLGQTGWKTGDIVEIVGGITHPPCLLADTMDDLKILIDWDPEEDPERPDARLFPVKMSQEAKVVAIEGTNFQVRMIGGVWADRLGWIQRDHVRRKPSQRELGGMHVEKITLENRRVIFADLCRAAILATYEADRLVTLDPTKLNPDSGQAEKQVELHKSAYLAALKRYRTDVAKNYKCDLAHLARIEAEGFREHWPVPEVKNPFLTNKRP